MAEVGVTGMPFYKAERDAGLGELLALSSVSYAAAVRVSEEFVIPEKVRARLNERAHASQGDLDLHFLNAILVSTGWNQNDDVFDPVETWLARRTPEDKPFNYEHQCDQIIGHITSSQAINDEGTSLADDLLLDDLPGKFHVLTGAVLYRYWEKPELQERMDTILAEIAKGEWYVSMEALFKGFDYALLAQDGSTRVVARNETTAFLTKHLRAYGGSGRYGDYKVGRLMRNIVFSGKGLVRQPANPESVILPEQTQAFVAARALFVSDLTSLGAAGVYSSGAESTEQEKAVIMTIEIETIQKQVADLKAENERLKASQQESVLTDLKARLSAVEGEKSQAEDLLKKSAVALQLSQTTAEQLTQKSQALETELTEVKEELSSLHAEQRKLTRLAATKDKLGFSDDKARAFVETNLGLSEEQFSSQLELLAGARAEWTTNNPQSGNTTFPAGSPAKPPKSTPAPLPPKSTPAKTVASEEDPAGERTVVAADFDKVEGAESGALSTQSPSAGVSDVAKAIANWFGCKTPDEASA